VRNQSQQYAKRPNPERSISMRLDLLKDLPDVEDTIVANHAEALSGLAQ
jgi:hypothetical protein